MNLKILYLSHSFPLISETFVIYEIADLLKSGADIRIVSLTKPLDAARSSLPVELGFADRIFYRPSLKKGVFAKLMRMAQLGAQLSLKMGKLPSFSPSEDFSRYALMETAACLPTDWKPNIVHCHFGLMGNLAANLKSRGMLNAKITTIFHGFDVSQLLKEKRRNFYDDLFKTGDHFFSINHYYLDIIRNLGAPLARSSLFHMSVDTSVLAFSPRICPENSPIHCISVGRMTEKKGFAYTIRAFAEVVKQKPQLDIRLDLVGDGPLMPELKKLADELGVSYRITFHGARQHTEVKKLLEAAHVFMLPSVTAANGDMEGIPVALIEAMAMGLPVFSTYHSGIPELIEDGVSGFLVAERESEALAQKMLYLLENPDIWPVLTSAAHQKIEREFDRKKQSALLFSTFKEITG